MRCLSRLLDRIFPVFEITDRRETSVYLRRRTLFWTPWLRIYIHSILRSDDDQCLHDHPWNFTSLILAGGYFEHLPRGGRKWRGPGSLIRHRAEDLHRVELRLKNTPLGRREQPALTLVVCGRKRRNWGFLTPAGWTYWREHLEAQVNENRD